MKSILAVLLVGLLAAVIPAAAPDRQTAPDHESEDVSLIAAWLAGVDESKAFDHPFGDSRLFTADKDVILYSDVAQASIPQRFRRVPYDFIQPRMERIRNAAKADPAVLITRSVRENPREGMLAQESKLTREPHPGERYYYVEVAFGNMAWHWMKIGVYEIDGKPKVEFLRSTVS